MPPARAAIFCRANRTRGAIGHVKLDAMSEEARTDTMHGVLLDRATIDTDDIEFDDLESIFSEWRAYDYTSKEEIHDRIADATIVVSNKVMLDEATLRSAVRMHSRYRHQQCRPASSERIGHPG